MSDLDDPGMTGVLRKAFAPLVPEGRWSLAAVASAAGRCGTWLSGASPASAFHIGSVTKTFTALLLATMAQKGQVSLEDPLSMYLGAASGASTRLVDLATHTSGYPRIPRELKLRMLLRLRDPYSLVGERNVDRALRRLSRQLGPPPLPFEYSNFGYGVLSRALAEAGGEPFGDLLRREVLEPLNLRGVTPETDPDPDRRRLFGHSDSGKEMEHWHNPALAGAGSLFSTVEGMAKYLAANLRPEATALRAPLELVHEARQAAAPGVRVALGWLLREGAEGPVHWHNGGTAGFGSFVCFDLRRQLGVAVLMSRRHYPELDTAALAVLSEIRRQVAAG